MLERGSPQVDANLVSTSVEPQPKPERDIFVKTATPVSLFLIGLMFPLILMLASLYYYTTPTIPNVDMHSIEHEYVLSEYDGTTYTLNFIVEEGRSLDYVQFICGLCDDDYAYDVRDINYGNGDEWHSRGIISFSIVRVPCHNGCIVNHDPGDIVGGWNSSDGVFLFDDGEHHRKTMLFTTVDTELYQENHDIWEKNNSNERRVLIACCLSPICSIALMLAGVGAAFANRHELWLGALVSLGIYPLFFIYMAIRVFNDSWSTGPW